VEILQAKLVEIEKSTLGRKAEVEEEVGHAGWITPGVCKKRAQFVTRLLGPF
jgi:hypothetical protein